jgi:hypothetical protein
MYRAILKEIGCDESNMEYLFDEDDDEDEDESDDNGGGGRSTGKTALHRGESNGHNKSDHDLLRSKLVDSTSDEELLHDWEADVIDEEVNARDSGSDKDNTDYDYEKDDPTQVGSDIMEKGTSLSPTPPLQSSDDESGGESSRLPEWKEMLLEATAQQQQLQQQIVRLKRAQKVSSPSNRQKHETRHQSRIPSLSSPPPSKPVVRVPSTPSSLSTAAKQPPAPLLEHISLNNEQLQHEWQSQQAATMDLQRKLTTLQTKFYNQQQLWEQERQVLFSPARSSGSGGGNVNNSISKKEGKELLDVDNSSPHAAENSSSSQATPGVRIGAKDASGTWFSLQDSPLVMMHNQKHKYKDQKIEELHAQVQELQSLQESTAQELLECKDRLSQRDLEHQTLFMKYEEEKKQWEDSKQSIQFHQELAEQAWKRDLEDAKDKLQQQVALNQDLREELQRIKSKSWKEELDETQNQIKIAIQQQMQKTREFQSRIQDLEQKHNEERRLWEGQLQDYQRQLEGNTANWERQVKEANDRYETLEEKYVRETKEWQQLLEVEMTKALDSGELGQSFDMGEEKWATVAPSTTPRTKVKGHGGGHHHDIGLLSPIPQTVSMRMVDDESSMDHSSVAEDKSAPSQSMEKIDRLLEELGRMDQERTNMLKEINGDGQENDNEGLIIWKNPSIPTSPKTVAMHDSDRLVTEDIDDNEEETPKPVESAPTSPEQVALATQSELNTSHDSTILNQTLSLLTNLKDMLICPGNGVEREITVLEHLEVLSELMQDQSSLQSLVVSPERRNSTSSLEPNERRLVRAENHGQPSVAESSVEAERDLSWIPSAVKAAEAVDPWPELVAALKSRCEFLELDRAELARITEQILHMERESHKVELEAVVSTAKREAKEALHFHQQDVNRHMRGVYRSLCIHCQQRVYATI